MEDSVAAESHIDVLHGAISWIAPVEWSSKLMCALYAHLLALERQRRLSCLPYSGHSKAAFIMQHVLFSAVLLAVLELLTRAVSFSAAPSFSKSQKEYHF
jgi:hypothetical protein